MDFQRRWMLPLVLSLYLFLVRLPGVSGLQMAYCSSDNNAGDNQSLWDQYQSNGLCQNHCQGAFAFAIIQGYNCWCSNYIPANQQNTYLCSQGCPGIDTEWCGNTNAGLYAYFQLSGGEPIGTSGSSSSNDVPSTSSSSVSSTSITSGSSAQSTSRPSSTSESSSSEFSSSSESQTTFWVTSIPIIIPGFSQSSVPSTTSSSTSTTETTESSRSVSSAPSSSSAAPSTTFRSSVSSPSSDSSSPTSASPTEVYTSVTTVTGEVRTVLVTPTASGGTVLSEPISSGSSGGVSPGKVAGIVVGVAVCLGLIVGAAVWWWFRRRHRNSEHDSLPDGTFSPQRTDRSSNTIPSRQVSQMSQAGLLGKRPRIQTTGLGGGNEPRSAEAMSANIDRRSLGTDQRLNPYALYSHDEAQLSSVSLQDNQDYSRQLRITNPDS